MYIHIYMYISFLGRKILLRRLLEEHNYRGDNICRKHNDVRVTFRPAFFYLSVLSKCMQIVKTAYIGKRSTARKNL